MEPKMVLPGDEIAVAEEFEPGDGTYERNGLVFAATPGVLFLDPENRVARVRAFNPPAELKIGDIIRAKVIQVKPSVQLTTAERNLGVVKALCSICRGPLELRGRELYCPRDERTERRKVAADYADLRLFVPATELGGGKVEEKHREPRGEGHDRGGRDRDRGGGRDRYRERGGGRGRDGRGPGGRGGRDRDRGRRR